MSAPFTMDFIHSITITGYRTNENERLVTISSGRRGSNFLMAATGSTLDHAEANCLALCERYINGEKVAFDKCCCQWIMGLANDMHLFFIAPLAKAEHPSRHIQPIEDFSQGERAGIMVYRCELCDEYWTVVFANSGSLERKDKVITHWGKSPDNITLTMKKIPPEMIDERKNKCFVLDGKPYTFSELKEIIDDGDRS